MYMTLNFFFVKCDIEKKSNSCFQNFSIGPIENLLLNYHILVLISCDCTKNLRYKMKEGMDRQRDKIKMFVSVKSSW